MFCGPLHKTQTRHPEIEKWSPQAPYVGDGGKGPYLGTLFRHLDMNSHHMTVQYSRVLDVPAKAVLTLCLTVMSCPCLALEEDLSCASCQEMPNYSTNTTQTAGY